MFFTFFITLQIILLFFMTFHDWIHLPPLTDIRALEKYSTFRGRIINSALFALIILIPLCLTYAYMPDISHWVAATLTAIYSVLTFGTIASWWYPYFFGNAQWHEENFQEYKETHHFLPVRGDNVIPNTMHVMIHVLIWMCLGFAVYLFFAAS